MQSQSVDLANRSSYTQWTKVGLRYSDTDGLGHVNNAVFATLLECGRIPIFHDEKDWLEGEGRYWVLANLNIDFRAEIRFPGTVEVGTAIESFGNSSIRLRQAIFQNGKCCATSHSTCVLIDESTKKGSPIDPQLRSLIEQRAR